MSEITFTTKSGEEITARLIPNTKHWYSATNTARVFQHSRRGVREKKQTVDNDGYYKTKIDNADVRINRIICSLFHGEPPTKHHQAAHNNGIKTDNRAENLRWATVSENATDRTHHGTQNMNTLPATASARRKYLRQMLQYAKAKYLPLHGRGNRTKYNQQKVIVWKALMALERAKVKNQ